MSRRKVTPEELNLWNRVANTTEKLDPKERQKFDLSEVLDTPPKPKFEIGQPLVVGSKSKPPSPKNDVLPHLSDQMSNQRIQMDKKTHQRLKSGKLVPEARLDLHGMTLAQAQPRLTEFILKAHARKKRLVLVISGKGKERDNGGPIPVRHGVLRHAVPQWLSQAPLASAVLQVTQAHARHGGGGAYYVYLRRAR